MDQQPPAPSRRRRPDPGIIRPARPTDIDAIIDLWSEYILYHERVCGEPISPQGAELRVRKVFLDALTNRYSCLLVAEAAGELVGYILGVTQPVSPIYDGGRVGIIHDLIVTERVRRRGIGGKLAREMFQWCTDRKATRIEITVLHQNRDAAQFWEAGGFTKFGIRYTRRP